MLPRAEYLEALRRGSASFVEILGCADLGLDIPDCPGWTLMDLAKHLGAVHRWAHDAVVTGAPGELPDGPDARDELTQWFTRGAAQLLDVLRETDPDAPTWTFGPRPHRVSFWTRRQAHETAMHVGDACRAGGLRVEGDADLAVDGVDEVVTMFFPRQVRLGRIPPLTHGVRIILTESPQTPYVLAGDGSDTEAHTDATVTGPAVRMLMALWGRGTIEGLDIEGDPAVVRAALAGALTP